MEKDLMEYLIRGKDYILKKLIICEIVSVVCLCFISVILSFADEPKQMVVALPVLLIWSLPLLLTVWYINHYFFYRIEIYPDGFYIRTNPFNGKYYYYSEIRTAYISFKDLLNKGGGIIKTIHFFRFVDSQGTRRIVYFDNTYCIKEIRLIVERISK